VTDTKQPADEPDAPQEPEAAPSRRRRRRTSEGGSMKATANAARTKVASLVWLAAVICALFLAVGALMVALNMNHDNAIVRFVTDVAHKIDFGEFKKFHGKSADVKAALTNWGIAAVIYLVIGKVLDRIIRP
jgi:hypothetical protein